MLKKDQLPGLTDDIISTVLKSLDKFDLFEHDGLLSTIPVGKIAGYFARKKIEIGDADKALQNAVAIAYYVAFIEAVNFFNLNSELPETATTTLKNRTKITTELKIFSFDRTKFDIDNFNNNEVTKFYINLLEKLLTEYQITEDNAIKIEKYIKDYVKLNFYQILEKNQTVYAKVHSFLNSKSYELIRENYLFDCYKTDLKNLFNEPVWNDTQGLTLNNLYVKPQFKIHQYCFKENDGRVKYDSRKDDSGFIRIHYPHASIHEFLHEVLLEKDTLKLKNPSPQLILLLGYPGQGKTSFCKKMLHDTYTHELPIDKDVFFVKFRNIRRVKDLIDNPLMTLRNRINEVVEDEISEKKIKDSVLLLDGLDELYMKENMQKNEIDEFIKSFLLEINNYSELKIIITTRYGYLDLAKVKERNVLICQLQELDIEQQKEWLSNYTAYHPECVLTNDKLQEIHENDNLKHIAELVKQPILLHMIARLPHEINSNDNRAKIYDKMFEALVKREYDTSGGQIENLRGPDEKDLRKLIREIAFEIFKSGNEYIHKSKLEQLEAVEKFIKKLENQQFNNALKGLMIAFYFQEVRKKEGDEGDEQEKREDYAIEFLHKSLKEYLVAEKIWITVKQFVNKDSEGDYTVDDFNQAMELTFSLFAYQELSREIIDYLAEIIQNDESIDKEEVHARLAYLFPYYIKNNFLKEYKAEKRPQLGPYDLANNHFYGYWSVISHLGIDKNVIPDDFELLDRLAVQLKATLHNSKYITLSKQKLSYMQLTGAILVGARLDRANLIGASLNGAILDGAILVGARLDRVKLHLARLNLTRLDGAILDGANFDRANLVGATLDRATLYGANFDRANLIKASFHDAILNKANFHGAILNEAILVRTNLKDIKGLTVAQLTRTASLKDCKNLDPALRQGVIDAGYGHLFE